jgi:hypothetical protein
MRRPSVRAGGGQAVAFLGRDREPNRAPCQRKDRTTNTRRNVFSAPRRREPHAIRWELHRLIECPK